MKNTYFVQLTLMLKLSFTSTRWCGQRGLVGDLRDHLHRVRAHSQVCHPGESNKNDACLTTTFRIVSEYQTIISYLFFRGPTRRTSDLAPCCWIAQSPATTCSSCWTRSSRSMLMCPIFPADSMVRSTLWRWRRMEAWPVIPPTR